jgi:hypothetical protein
MMHGQQNIKSKQTSYKKFNRMHKCFIFLYMSCLSLDSFSVFSLVSLTTLNIPEVRKFKETSYPAVTWYCNFSYGNWLSVILTVGVVQRQSSRRTHVQNELNIFVYVIQYLFTSQSDDISLYYGTGTFPVVNPLPLLFKALLHGQKDRVFFSGLIIYIQRLGWHGTFKSREL